MTFDYIIDFDRHIKKTEETRKYDYAGASALWDLYSDLLLDPWELDSCERQKARREFMRAVTRHQDIKPYIDYIYERIDDMQPLETAKSRVFDFDYENQLTDLIWKIKTFYKRGREK